MIVFCNGPHCKSPADDYCGMTTLGEECPVCKRVREGEGEMTLLRIHKDGTMTVTLPDGDVHQITSIADDRFNISEIPLNTIRRYTENTEEEDERRG